MRGTSPSPAGGGSTLASASGGGGFSPQVPIARREEPHPGSLRSPTLPLQGKGKKGGRSRAFTGPGKRALVVATQTGCRGGSSGGLDVQRTNRGGLRCL